MGKSAAHMRLTTQYCHPRRAGNDTTHTTTNKPQSSQPHNPHRGCTRVNGEGRSRLLGCHRPDATPHDQHPIATPIAD
eukprot:4552887-Prymnesium_polylepis.1